MQYAHRSIDWCERALASEIAYSVARGGVPTDYGAFIHILNGSVPWGGDYNRAVGVRAADTKEFDLVVERVARIHREHALQSPDHFDMLPAERVDPAFLAAIPRDRYRVVSDVFCCREARDIALPAGFEWRRVNVDEYADWWLRQQQLTDSYDADWCTRDLPLERVFAATFVPYWLVRDGVTVAWVHCADLGGYFRLFSVEVGERERGRGLGRLLLRAVEAEAVSRGLSHVLIRCLERLIPFYEACGFEECCRGTMIRTARRAPAANGDVLQTI